MGPIQHRWEVSSYLEAQTLEFLLPVIIAVLPSSNDERDVLLPLQLDSEISGVERDTGVTGRS